MCARIFYLLIAAMLVFVVGTIAAFRYLDWWLAPFVSTAILILLLRIGKFLTVRTFKNSVGNLAKGLFDVKSRVLRGATVDVHSVRATTLPANLLDPLESANQSRMAWFEIESTIFPDPRQAGQTNQWELAGLRLVSAEAKPFDSNSSNSEVDEGLTLHNIQLMENGIPSVVVDGVLRGPCRIRFAVGVPRTIHTLKFQYFFEQFGEIKLPSSLSLPMGR